MTSIDEIVRELRDRDAIVLSGLFYAVPVMRRAADALEAERARSRRMEEALREIATHWACDSDHKHANTEAYRGPYGIGIVDGHRAAALIARAALREEIPNGTG